jgi:hypothetical protein
MTYEEAYAIRKRINAEIDKLHDAPPPNDGSGSDHATMQLNAVARYVEASVSCRERQVERELNDYLNS